MKKSRSKAIDRLENALLVAMRVFGVEKIESPVMKIVVRKSESVEFDDSGPIPERFIIVKTSESIDKVAIKAAIKAGEGVPGAFIKVNQNLQIK